MNINKAVTKKYAEKSLKELADAPTSALKGLSENDQKYLYDAFQISTIRELANNKFFKWAQAIINLAETEE